MRIQGTGTPGKHGAASGFRVWIALGFYMILIIDFGSQYNQLIARRVRECRVFCRIAPPDVGLAEIKQMQPLGIILSGGPASIYEPDSPKADPGIFDLGLPVLGICYGMHFMTQVLGGKVAGADKREYGFASLQTLYQDGIFKNLGPKSQTWMSHGDSVKDPPAGFRITAFTDNTPVAAMADDRRRLYGLQFHPEVLHTANGKQMIKNFVVDVCKSPRNWNMRFFAKKSVAEIKDAVGDAKVVLGLSGGVDSSVAAVLIHKAVGKNLTCISVDTGLLRKGELDQLRQTLCRDLDMNIVFKDARDRFLSALDKVEDPEKKRKIIGNLFIQVFEQEAKKNRQRPVFGPGHPVSGCD